MVGAMVVAAAPPTTNASLLTSGTLPDARLSANIARTSDVSSAVAAVVNAAPAALDTLNELAAALGNDASFSVTVTNALASKAPLANPTFTGTVSGITKAMVGLGNVPNTDATARANHTGTQAVSTISGLQAALDAKAPLVEPNFTGPVEVDGLISATGDVIAVGAMRAGSLLLSTFPNAAVFSISTTGVVVTGTWQGTAVGVGFGGTGATTASAARTNLGLAIGTDVAAASHTQAWSTITSTPTTLAGYGITDAVSSSDSRLTDARTPLFHTHSALDLTSGTLDIARLPVGQTSTTVAAGNDARFTDARTPLAHVHSGADITSGTVADARLSANARQAIDNLFHPFLLAGM